MITAADTPTITSPWVTLVVTVIAGACSGGGIVAAFRVKADRGKVVIETAQGAVIVQTGVMEELRKELTRLQSEIAELRDERDAEVTRLRAEVAALRAGRDAEVAELRAEVARLRTEGAVTATRVTKVEQAGDPGPAA